MLGFAIAAGRSHHLSDVLGAFLLAAAVAARGLVGRTPPGEAAPAFLILVGYERLLRRTECKPSRAIL